MQRIHTRAHAHVTHTSTSSLLTEGLTWWECSVSTAGAGDLGPCSPATQHRQQRYQGSTRGLPGVRLPGPGLDRHCSLPWLPPHQPVELVVWWCILKGGHCGISVCILWDMSAPSHHCTGAVLMDELDLTQLWRISLWRYVFCMKNATSNSHSIVQIHKLD